MPSSTYSVRVTKDYLVFCAGHFITYNGDHCERIHGHNYRVAVEVEDDLDENHYVFDFIALKDLMRELTNELDHRMLLPTTSTKVRLEEAGTNVVVRYQDRHWMPPGYPGAPQGPPAVATYLDRNRGPLVIGDVMSWHPLLQGVMRTMTASPGLTRFRCLESDRTCLNIVWATPTAQWRSSLTLLAAVQFVCASLTVAALGSK